MKSILVVDDNKLNLASARKTLSGEYKAIPVMRGEQALSYLEHGECDIILLDINMSQIDKLIDAYPAPIQNDQPFRFCGHDTVNAILVYYSDICQNCKIDFSAEVNIHSRRYIQR